MLNAIFERMQDDANEPILGYINSDIILLPGLAEGLAAVRARFDAFLMIAGRWNVDEDLPALDFTPGWDERLRDLVLREGEQFSPYGIDLFVFSRGLLREIPPFALGSDYWDNYLVMSTRRRGYPVVDATRQVMLVHQNHALGKYRSAAERRRGPEGLRALALAGDSHAMLGGCPDATHVVVQGEVRLANTARVTVVVPHRGDPRRLCRCLRSLEYQSYPRSFLDAIVVNNDPEAALRYLEADFPSVRVVTEVKAGAAAARNKGISCADSAVVALFDSDIVPALDCLERAMQTLADHPECQLVVCRVDPLFSKGPVSYLRGAVEWFDALAHYSRGEWLTGAGTAPARALIARKAVFAKYGYFTELRRDAPSAEREWARRVLAAGLKVAYCRDAVVRHETVKSIAELRYRQQRAARGDCLLRSLESGDVYHARAIIRDEWSQFRTRARSIWHDTRMPAQYRTGVLLVSLWSVVWTVRAKLRFREQAERIARRRRQEIDGMNQKVAEAAMPRAPLPWRWLGIRGPAQRIPGRDASERSASS
jgi:GT2 family glycosyltransferase